MKLKTKLTSGLGFLFFIIFALAAFCSYYVGTLGQESERILKDNYDSLVYARNMVAGLEDIKTSVTVAMYTSRTSEHYARLFESGKKLFEENLKLERNNITEVHEKEYVEALTQEYASFLKLSVQLREGPAEPSAYIRDFLPATERVRESIRGIYDVNMEAVVRKSQQATRDATRFMQGMAMIGAICLVLALGYFWYFPVYISSTMSYLAERMSNLVKKSGVPFEATTNDEADIMLQGIKALEEKLGVNKESVNTQRS
ncbi:MAG TPA: hypothetical protein VMT71_13960 [Syntrophorhabdales bacterium]|nr:hypothetical protein [Syntrophorhabdales bacterium]